MIVLGIDPGTKHSGVVVWNTKSRRVIASWKDCDNEMLRSQLMGGYVFKDWAGSMIWPPGRCYIETIVKMGDRIGTTVLETMRWVGIFQQAWDGHAGTVDKLPAMLVSRREERRVICGNGTAGDKQLRRELLAMFSPGKGTKGNPGPLYGVSGHAWSALAVAITGLRL